MTSLFHFFFEPVSGGSGEPRAKCAAALRVGTQRSKSAFFAGWDTAGAFSDAPKIFISIAVPAAKVKRLGKMGMESKLHKCPFARGLFGRGAGPLACLPPAARGKSWTKPRRHGILT